MFSTVSNCQTLTSEELRKILLLKEGFEHCRSQNETMLAKLDEYNHIIHSQQRMIDGVEKMNKNQELVISDLQESVTLQNEKIENLDRKVRFWSTAAKISVALIPVAFVGGYIYRP